MTEISLKTIKKEYDRLVKSGMFFEFYPQLTGNWRKDKEEWISSYRNKQHESM